MSSHTWDQEHILLNILQIIFHFIFSRIRQSISWLCITVTKVSERNNLRKRGFTWAPFQRVPSLVHWLWPWQQEEDTGTHGARAGFIPQGTLPVSHFLQPGLIVSHLPAPNITLMPLATEGSAQSIDIPESSPSTSGRAMADTHRHVLH